MMTVKQVSLLTGVSVRTLQFYDGINLLKPTEITDAGYRLYDEAALETLQQILFFKELDFTLKEIKSILDNPQFNKKAAFEKQRELIRLKRDRLNGLLNLLDRLVKGENCMEFKEFDMSGYFRVLADFKKNDAKEIIQAFGSMNYFDELISHMKAKEQEIGELAVKQYGSIENYAAATKENLQKYLSDGPIFAQEEALKLAEEAENLTKQLTADLTKDPASLEIQEALYKLISFINQCNSSIDMGENYWPLIAEHYCSNSLFIKGNDKKYGEGSSNFIGLALKTYLGQS